MLYSRSLLFIYFIYSIVALAFHHCVINDHKCSGLKQHKFIISQFLGSGVRILASWLLCSGFHKTEISDWQGLRISPEAGDSLVVGWAWFLADSQPRIALGPRGPHSALAAWPSYARQHFFKASRGTFLQPLVASLRWGDLPNHGSDTPTSSLSAILQGAFHRKQESQGPPTLLVIFNQQDKQTWVQEELTPGVALCIILAWIVVSTE